MSKINLGSLVRNLIRSSEAVRTDQQVDYNMEHLEKFGPDGRPMVTQWHVDMGILGATTGRGDVTKAGAETIERRWRTSFYAPNQSNWDEEAQRLFQSLKGEEGFEHVTFSKPVFDERSMKINDAFQQGLGLRSDGGSEFTRGDLEQAVRQAVDSEGRLSDSAKKALSENWANVRLSATEDAEALFKQLVKQYGVPDVVPQ